MAIQQSVGICIKANPSTQLYQLSTVQGNKENIVLSGLYITIPWFKKLQQGQWFWYLLLMTKVLPEFCCLSVYVCVSFSFSVACSGLGMQCGGKKVKRINNATSLNTRVDLVCVSSGRLTAWRAGGSLLPTMCSQSSASPSWVALQCYHSLDLAVDTLPSLQLNLLLRSWGCHQISSSCNGVRFYWGRKAWFGFHFKVDNFQ